MKRLYLFSPLALLSGLFFILFVMSCKKGDTGPAGPKGDSGSTVIYSDWLDVKYKADTVHRTGGKIDTIGYYADIDAPKLTKDLLSTADVKAFINSSDASDPVIYALPYVGISGLNVEVKAYTGTIELYSNGDLSTYTANGKKIQQYRYMIVPGTVTARAVTPVNWSDYAAVKAYLGLKD